MRFLNKSEDLIQEADKPYEVNILLEGWATRYKITEAGKFQTLAFLIPGDACDVHITLIERMDHSICAIIPSKFTSIPQHRIEEMYVDHPRLARALFWSMLVDESTLREWILNIAGRQADQRMAHLFCELLIRSRAAGLTSSHGFILPLTQQQVGEAMGITPVHTSRVLTRLRTEGLISWESKFLQIHDWKRVKDFCGFDATYLHLDRAHPSLAQDL
ncbi:Crp/Fnr family transcriptional regulator [Vreelandella nanhaiensis]|uniref:Crp/Fnr family transcriptional regulator n=1 Tax=Vreelandella nanhaiensis TaxID=1258546 RepID=A0A3S0W8K4_9GAMM|nr:Crp/Fnr family transcriptional regulator [Halomonas nanhaiensis]